jgi:hypothetical protein
VGDAGSIRDLGKVSVPEPPRECDPGQGQSSLELSATEVAGEAVL